MVFIKQMLIYLSPVIGYEEMNVVYPELLKRLDDAQDGIRIETA